MTEFEWSAAVSQGSQFVATGNFVQNIKLFFPITHHFGKKIILQLTKAFLSSAVVLVEEMLSE